MLQTILDAVKEAGLIAKRKQEGIESCSKEDKSPVTEVDIELSAFIRSRIKKFTDLDNHMFVDEEFEEGHAEQYLRFENVEYAWFVDPIAGTMAYLNGLSFYAVSIGVLRNGKFLVPSVQELAGLSGEKGSKVFDEMKKSGDKIYNDITVFLRDRYAKKHGGKDG